MNINVADPGALPGVAQQVLEFAGKERFFTFNGSMGAGKTTFIKSLCALMGVTDVVTSPTFSIVNEYAADGGTIYHFDFYRLKTLEEAYDIGYEEYFYSDSTCLVEWPEKVAPLLPASYVSVHIEIGEGQQRIFSFEKHGA